MPYKAQVSHKQDEHNNIWDHSKRTFVETRGGGEGVIEKPQKRTVGGGVLPSVYVHFFKTGKRTRTNKGGVKTRES